MTKPTDTSPEADRVLTEVYQRMPIGKKWLLLGEDYRCAKILHAAGIRQRNPAATLSEIQEAWFTAARGAHATPLAGSTPAHFMGTPSMDQNLENLQVLREVAGIFDNLAIPYALGGAMASSLYGINRYTRDADLAVEPFPGHVAQLAASFGRDYYVSVAAIQDAIQRRASFNIIHTRTGFKIDVFIRKDRPFEESAMKRRVAVVLPDLPAQPMTLLTPEDAVLFKLEWYRLSNEALDQQWKDILGVLKVQAGRMDEAYLDRWAAELHVSDLLAKAREQIRN
jgi:hypothetical protein